MAFNFSISKKVYVVDAVMLFFAVADKDEDLNATTAATVTAVILNL